jgi:hypothetical protein
VSLFANIDRQATEVAQKIHGGQTSFKIGGGQGKSSLLRAIALRLPTAPVIVTVAPQADAHLYAMLTAASQAGVDSLRKVANALGSRGSLAEGLGVLRDALHGRFLMVDDADLITSAGDAELSAVFKAARHQVRHAMETRADVVVLREPREGGAAFLRPDLGMPVANKRWDSNLVWSLAGSDVDLYTLAVSRRLVLGTAERDANLPWRLDTAIRHFWFSLPDVLRDLVGLLFVHGRAVPRTLFERLGLIVPDTINRARDGYVVDQVGDMLSLASYWHRTADLADLVVRSSGHQRLAKAFETQVSNEQWGGLAVLEAHRHFASVPDIERARAHARFGVEILVDLARSQSLRRRYESASSTYETVLALDQQLKKASPAGIDPRARAYALHYAAYNRYRAGSAVSIERTIAQYRESLADWPDNALFWSRLINAYLIAGWYKEGVRARAHAFEQVEEHAEREHLLVVRTTEHLLNRRLPLEAAIAWGGYRPSNVMEEELRDRLVQAWQTMPQKLWTPRLGRVVVSNATPTKVSLHGEQFRVEIFGIVEEANSLLEALDLAMGSLVVELLMLVSASDDASAPRRAELVEGITLDTSAPDETTRWTAALTHVAAAVIDGTITHAQRTTFLDVWRTLQQRFAGIRRPAIRITDDGVLQIGWSFVQPPGALFTMDIHRDGTLDWYLRDPEAAESVASEVPTLVLPANVVDRLEIFAL